MPSASTTLPAAGIGEANRHTLPDTLPAFIRRQAGPFVPVRLSAESIRQRKSAAFCIEAEHDRARARSIALVELKKVAASLRRMQRAGACVPDVERLLTDVHALRQRVHGEWDG